MASNIYRGFTSKGYGKCPMTAGTNITNAISTASVVGSNTSFKLTDMETVKDNILNHIFTRPGERVMMPTFGTTIPDIIFEPLDDFTINSIQEQIEYVVNYDPRVNLISLNIIPDYDANSVTVMCDLFFIELNSTGQLNFNIEFQ